MRIFGFDIGTTSIGFAVIDHDPVRETGKILRLGVRIFPEARDPDGTPLNQNRRQKRMVRRQLRRRRMRRRMLNEELSTAGFLPTFGSPEWPIVMNGDPLQLRERGLVEPLTPHEFGRAIYHLAQRRHFKGRDLEESNGESEEAADEKAAKDSRESTLQTLKTEAVTLGQFLAGKNPHDRKRGVHASRSAVFSEFEQLWASQTFHHAALQDSEYKARIADAIFAQRPVFWRKNTLGDCRLMPGETLCPKGSWLSQQRRMLEKLNNLAIADGNMRPLDEDERAAILEKLQVQASMSWAGVRAALKPVFKSRGEAGRERSLRFNLELGGESKLLGNAVEAKLASVFKEEWPGHPHRQAIRDAIHERLWSADYGVIGDQRVVILSERDRQRRRSDAVQSLIDDFGVAPERAAELSELKLPTGWEPFSIAALKELLPHLEAGVRFGALINGPEWKDWRNRSFPKREQPTGEILDRLPSPADREEQRRIMTLRNPTVIRTQNELRKVVNNLIGMFGKPDLIRVELAREVGKSKREREDMQNGIRKQERRRKDAVADLRSKGIEPSRPDIEKWLLWKESQERCPYTGDHIGFDDLFRAGEYEVEHIWPRSRSFDDSFRNKTLCRKDVNIAKGNRIPFEQFEHREDEWTGIVNRLQGMIAPKGGIGMSPGKVRRFLSQSMPEDFANRQLNDTGYAARQAISFLKRLWPDVGIEAPVTVQAVTGRVTAQLRKLWSLNNILSDDGEKTRADHRHHAIDALVVACAHPGMTQRLSAYWQAKDDPAAPRPHLPPPWANIRNEADRAVAEIVVSHRVRKKVSGPLHKETTYGDTGEEAIRGKTAYRHFVTRKKVEALTPKELGAIRDRQIRHIVGDWVEAHGGDPKKAFSTYPRVNPAGPEIRKVRIIVEQQLSLMASVSTGYASLGNNHHLAIYKMPDGKAEFEIVSLLEASRRLARREPIVKRNREDRSTFVMSAALGDTVRIPEGEKAGLWVANILSANGQIFFRRIEDATSSPEGKWGPNPNTLLKERAQKVSIDPIGRVRSAND